MSTKRGLAAVAAAGTLLLLSGCTPADAMAARLNDSGAIEIVVCYDVDAQVVGVRLEGGSGDAWLAEGRALLSEDTPIVYGQTPEGMEVEAGPKELAADDTIVVRILPADSSADSGARGVFAIADLRADAWLRADGRQTDTACP